MRRTTLLILLVSLCAVFGAQSASAADSGPDAYADQASLLLKRVDALRAVVPAGRFPIGTGSDGVLRYAPGSDWNSGFWAGTLWHAYDLDASTDRLDAARAATSQHLGFERTKFHDLGFMYADSSALGALHECGLISEDNARCKTYKKSALKAAKTLLALASTTGQKIIPMSAKTCSDCPRGGTETIVDSMMNLRLLYWAAAETKNPAYNRLARRHANWVAKYLERADGSTYQAGRYVRKAKKPRVMRHTHQGLSNNSVWSRGQAWSIYGFASAGSALHNRYFLAIAERNADYVDRHLPADGLPLWDYRAGADAPRDVSAGVITAAGLFYLSSACKAIKNGCFQPERWAPLARKILTGSLARINPTTGYLGDQAYNLRNNIPWDDNAELTFGLDYALEAISLARRN